MFNRIALKNLEIWKNASTHKPLVIRGARQVGKTKLVDAFAQVFSHYAYLNLERDADRRIFDATTSVADIVRSIEVLKQVRVIPGETLLFLDEIQNCPKAIQQLRYFFEDYPRLHVVAAGSLLEAVMVKEGFSFPVGRVEFQYLYPATFDEFLGALGELALREAVRQATVTDPLPIAVHEQVCQHFKTYMIVGGMPEVVATYAATRSLMETAKVAESLLAAFEEDVHKYSRSTQVPYVRHVLQSAPLYAGQRITYEHFGNSGFKSREVKRAMEVLEYAMIVQRVIGTHVVFPPIQPNTRVAPKLLYLDVGLVAHRFKADTVLNSSDTTNSIFQGTLAEQVVGQELLAISSDRRDVPSFWYRNQPGATAEVDYCMQMQDRIIPIEVKSGKPGTLKSLQQFMKQAPHDLAVRVSFENLKLEAVQLSDKQYKLLNVPIYMVGRLNDLVKAK